MKLPINTPPAQPSSQDGKAARGFVVWLTVQPRSGDRASKGAFFAQRLVCLFVQKRFVHRIIHEAHQQHTAHQIAKRHRNQIVNNPAE